MNSDRIEELAIFQLKNLLLKCEHIKSDIKENDKTLSWDGTLFLYSSTEFTKRTLKAKCELQVKGKEKLGNARTYPVAVADLINYKNNGGVLYFVVDIETKTVFYVELLPIKIGRIFKDKPNAISQHTVNVELEVFPVEPLPIEILVDRFCKHSDRQRYTKGKIIDLKLDKIDLNGSSSYHGELNLIQEEKTIYLSNKETYLYKVNSDGTILPLDLVSIRKLYRKTKADVYIDGQFYFESIFEYVITKKDEEPYLLINNCIYIYTNENINNPLRFKLDGTLDEIKNSCQLVEAIVRGSRIKIGDFIEFSCEKSQENLEEIIGISNEFIQVYTVLKELNINTNILYSKFTEDDISKLLWLSNHFSHIRLDLKDSVKDVIINVYDFSFFSVVLLVGKNKKDELEFFNPFEVDLTISDIHDPKEIKYPFFFILNPNTLSVPVNIDFAKMLSAIDSLNTEALSSNISINFLLDLLFSFDKLNNNKLLEIARQLARRLYDFEPTVLNFINYLQCVKRVRNIDDDEADKLISLSSDYTGEKKELIDCAVDLLTNNKHGYRNKYRELNDDLKEEFDSYPIKSLEKLLN